MHWLLEEETNLFWLGDGVEIRKASWRRWHLNWVFSKGQGPFQIWEMLWVAYSRQNESQRHGDKETFGKNRK